MENVFTWTEEYQIYVTTDPFEAGAPVVRSDAAIAIHEQQLFTLTEYGTRQVTDPKGECHLLQSPRNAPPKVMSRCQTRPIPLPQ